MTLALISFNLLRYSLYSSKASESSVGFSV
nr:MAG TPA: hypothetical protein [Caudoviricetes sp.]